MQGNDSRVGVAEEATNVRGSRETGERIEMAELGVLWHHFIVTDFAKAEKTKTASKSRRFRGLACRFYPHESPKHR